MTNKQIIIDGVDVAKCRCFTSEWDFNNCGHICKGTECKYKRLWYKKQLKRKEQECEKFESRADELKNTLAKVNEKINRIVEIDGNAFDEALTNEIESIQNLIRKAIFETGEIE